IHREDVEAITRTLIEKAKNGSESAAKLIYQYVLGKPLAGISPDWVEQDEWQLRMARPSQAEFGIGCFDRRPIFVANVMGRAMDHKWQTEAHQQLRGSIEKDIKRQAAEERRAAARAAREKNGQVPKTQ